MSDMPSASDTHPTDDLPEESAQHERLHAIVYGGVQGVGFRMSTQREAARLQLVGWVKNNWDRTVETVAEGPRADLEAFEQFLRRGPRAATVDRVSVTYSAATGSLRGFNIRY